MNKVMKVRHSFSTIEIRPMDELAQSLRELYEKHTRIMEAQAEKRTLGFKVQEARPKFRVRTIVALSVILVKQDGEILLPNGPAHKAVLTKKDWDPDQTGYWFEPYDEPAETKIVIYPDPEGEGVDFSEHMHEFMGWASEISVGKSFIEPLKS